MTESSFAKKQMSRYGWTEGKGLGKDEHGMRHAIKVSVKNNNHGLGLDPHDEFHWWDHVFNKVASSIKVETDGEECKISRTASKCNADQKLSVVINKRPDYNSAYLKKTKELLYGRFVSAGTVDTSGSDSDKLKPSQCHKKASAGEYINRKDKKDTKPEHERDYSKADTLDRVFHLTGGLTAHKAARHGLKLNGKLKRLQDHEEQPAAQESAEFSDEIFYSNQTSKKKKKKKSKRNLETAEPCLATAVMRNNLKDPTSNHESEEMEPTIISEPSKKEMEREVTECFYKEIDKQQNSDNLDINESVTNKTVTPYSCSQVLHETCHVRKKGKKSKKRKTYVCDDVDKINLTIDAKLLEEHTSVIEPSENLLKHSKKKKKKHK